MRGEIDQVSWHVSQRVMCARERVFIKISHVQHGKKEG